MKKSVRAVATIGATLAFAAATLPASAWVYSWNGVVKFQSFKPSTSSLNEYGRLYDIADNGVPVRNEYGRANLGTYTLANPNGYGTFVQGPTVASRIQWTIICDDYSLGDDCSGKHSA